MINSRDLLTDVTKLTSPIAVTITQSGPEMIAKKYGTWPIRLFLNGANLQGRVVHPDLKINLLSVSAIESRDGEVLFQDGKVKILLNK